MIDDGFNCTVVLTCGHSLRLNIQPLWYLRTGGMPQIPQVGWFYACFECPEVCDIDGDLGWDHPQQKAVEVRFPEPVSALGLANEIAMVTESFIQSRGACP